MAATEQLSSPRPRQNSKRRVPHVDAGLIRDLVTKAYDELMPEKVESQGRGLIVPQVRDILDGRHTAA